MAITAWWSAGGVAYRIAITDLIRSIPLFPPSTAHPSALVLLQELDDTLYNNSYILRSSYELGS